MNGFAGLMIDEFIQKKTLNELGYQLDVNELYDYEVDAFQIIQSTITKIQNDNAESALKKMRAKKRGK